MKMELLPTPFLQTVYKNVQYWNATKFENFFNYDLYLVSFEQIYSFYKNHYNLRLNVLIFERFLVHELEPKKVGICFLRVDKT